jgi:dephospho-CoA kinase
MPVLGITGGPACGKSSFARLLAGCLPNVVSFSADEEVRRLTDSDSEVRDAIERLLPEAYTPEGEYDRARVRRYVFERPELREGLNAILHPKVRVQWSRLAESCKNNENWLLAEIPLLYETGASSLCDRIATVGCTMETQLHRLTVLRGLSLTVADQIRRSQWSLEEKISRADHLIWNDSPFTCLTRQTALFAAWLQIHFA